MPFYCFMMYGFQSAVSEPFDFEDEIQFLPIKSGFIAQRFRRRIVQLMNIDLMQWQLMIGRFYTSEFRRTSDAHIGTCIWKRVLIALLAVSFLFGTPLSAVASPAPAPCTCFMLMENNVLADHRIMSMSAHEAPCKCAMHDCMSAACCGLVAGLLPPDELVTPADRTSEAVRMPQVDRSDVSLPPALPPPIGHG